MLVDTHVNYDPSAEQLAEITVHGGRGDAALRHAAARWRCCRTQLRHAATSPRRVKMREALALLQRARALARGRRRDARRRRARRRRTAHELHAASPLTGEANLLVLPNIDAANIAYNLLKTAAGGGIAIGPSCSARPSRCTS